MSEIQLIGSPMAPEAEEVVPALVGAERVLQPLARRGVFRRLMRDWTARIGFVLVVLLVLAAVLAPLLAPHEPLALDGGSFESPSWSHPFGTDRLGRDLFSRILFGARLSLGTAFFASLLITFAAVFVGSVTGFLGGAIDSVVMRVVDTILAFPSLLLAIVVAGLFKPSLWSLMLALASVWWVGYARIVRGLVLAVRERQFVTAARVAGGRSSRILIRHILPNVLPPVIVLATLEMGTLILAISALSFLGLGAQPPTPEWGAMLNEGKNHFFSAPHLMLFPGLAISAAVLGFNLLGDGLRDVLDPKS